MKKRYIFSTALISSLACAGSIYAQDSVESDVPQSEVSQTAEAADEAIQSAENAADAAAAEAEEATQAAQEAAAEAQDAAAEAQQEAEARAAAEADAAEAQQEAAAAEARAAAAEAEAEAAAEAAAEAERGRELSEEELSQLHDLQQAANERRAEAASAREAALDASAQAEAQSEASARAERNAVEAERAALRAERELAEFTGETHELDGDFSGQWVGYLDIGGSITLNSATNVPGEARGLSIGANAAISGVLDFLKGNHEWRNSLTWDIGTTRSASDEVWTKSVDRFVLASGYYYTVTDWFGPFAEFRFQTNFFPLEIRRGSDVSFCEGELQDDGTCAGNELENGESFSATNAFEPIQLDEKVGVYFRLFDRTYFQWVARAGFGAQQFFVGDNAYRETGRNDDGVELELMDQFGILGFMADTNMTGAVNEGAVQYGARAAILYPFAGTDTADGISPLQVDLGAFVNFTVAEWLGFRISGEAYRQPQVTADDWQTRLNVLATFSYSVFGDRESAREASSTLRFDDLEGADGDAGVE